MIEHTSVSTALATAVETVVSINLGFFVIVLEISADSFAGRVFLLFAG